MTDKQTDLRVDISFNMINSVRAADLIKKYMAQYPSLPHLVFVLKQFLYQRNLNEVWTGGLSSYALILMCVRFLQEEPADTPIEHVNLGNLLINFFELYGRSFNYRDLAISVKNGGCYVRKEVIQRNMEPGQHPSILCVEDPLCPGNDVGRRSYCVTQIRQAFAYAYVVLINAVLPQYSFLHGQTDQSILRRIIQLSPQSIENRSRIRAVGTNLLDKITPAHHSRPFVHFFTPPLIGQPPRLMTSLMLVTGSATVVPGAPQFAIHSAMACPTPHHQIDPGRLSMDDSEVKTVDGGQSIDDGRPSSVEEGNFDRKLPLVKSTVSRSSGHPSSESVSSQFSSCPSDQPTNSAAEVVTNGKDDSRMGLSDGPTYLPLTSKPPTQTSDDLSLHQVSAAVSSTRRASAHSHQRSSPVPTGQRRNAQQRGPNAAHSAHKRFANG